MKLEFLFAPTADLSSLALYRDGFGARRCGGRVMRPSR